MSNEMNNTSTTPSVAEYNLNDEVNRVSVYVYPLIILLILFTNIINVIILTRRSLRSSSCTYYFLSLSITSLIFVFIGPSMTFVSVAFNISVYASPFGCRMQLFLVFSAVLYFTVILVCASIDRFCSSSISMRLRQFSRPRIARRMILITVLLVIIYISPFTWTYLWNSQLNRCVQSTSPPLIVYLASRVIVYYLVGPLIMSLFGILTIRNIQKQRTRVIANNGQGRSRRLEVQLNGMLIIQIGIHLLFSLPVAVTYTMVTFAPSLTTPLISGIRAITVVWQTGTFFLSFFLYTLSGSVYRKELRKLFIRRRNLPENAFREVAQGR